MFNVSQLSGTRQLKFCDSVFFKEVILLPDDKTTHVPRRAKKAWLFENGHVKSALEFGCGWDSDKIMHAITAAFQPAVEGCR